METLLASKEPASERVIPRGTVILNRETGNDGALENKQNGEHFRAQRPECRARQTFQSATSDIPLDCCTKVERYRPT